jgi:hypothetical protein
MFVLSGRHLLDAQWCWQTIIYRPSIPHLNRQRSYACKFSICILMTLIFCQYTSSRAQLILHLVLFFLISSSISYPRTLLYIYLYTVRAGVWLVANCIHLISRRSAVGGRRRALYLFSLSSRRESRVAVIISIWHLPRIQTCRVSARVMKPWTRSNLADTVNSRQPCHASVIRKRQPASQFPLLYTLLSFLLSFRQTRLLLPLLCCVISKNQVLDGRGGVSFGEDATGWGGGLCGRVV